MTAPADAAGTHVHDTASAACAAAPGVCPPEAAQAQRGRGVAMAVLRVCLWLAYPAVFLISTRVGSPRYLGAALLILLWLQRWLGAGSVAILLRRLSAVDWCVLSLLTLCSAAATLTGSELMLRLYPSAVNLGLLVSFGMSLKGPQPMIEKFARMRYPDLSRKAQVYTRRVTEVWCGFFAVNIVLSVYTALHFSREAWALYNGVIVYAMVGALLVGERAWRQWVARPHSGVAH